MPMPPTWLLISITPLSFFLPCRMSVRASFLPFDVSLSRTFFV